MTRLQLAASTRALIAGAICLAIVGGMLVSHAWPLWTGRDVLIPATVNGAPRWTPGQSVSLSMPADRLLIGAPDTTSQSPPTAVRAIEPWVTPDLAERSLYRRLHGKAVYVQLEATPGGEYAPVSVSLQPVRGATNLRGIVTGAPGPREIHVEYGLDAFYMQEVHASAVEKAYREKRQVQMQVAIASSGRARIRTLLVDGVAVH